ncbi:MAG: hypothetical protein Q7R45_17435 [Sulfuricaulis sp.]|nr:hypothetical protein [Sulfuricaulis sp.]
MCGLGVPAAAQMFGRDNEYRTLQVRLAGNIREIGTRNWQWKAGATACSVSGWSGNEEIARSIEHGCACKALLRAVNGAAEGVPLP